MVVRHGVRSNLLSVRAENENLVTQTSEIGQLPGNDCHQHLQQTLFLSLARLFYVHMVFRYNNNNKYRCL